MATREELRRAVQELGELRKRHPERTFWIQELGDWVTVHCICAKPFKKPKWYDVFLPRPRYPRRGVVFRAISITTPVEPAGSSHQCPSFWSL